MLGEISILRHSQVSGSWAVDALVLKNGRRPRLGPRTWPKSKAPSALLPSAFWRVSPENGQPTKNECPVFPETPTKSQGPVPPLEEALGPFDPMFLIKSRVPWTHAARHRRVPSQSTFEPRGPFLFFPP